MGVEVFEVKKPFEAKLDRVSPIPMPGGGISSKTAGGKNGGTYLLSHDWNNSAIAVNRLLGEPGRENGTFDVYWTAESRHEGAKEIPAGTIVVRQKGGKDPGEGLAELERKARVYFVPTRARLDTPAWKLRAPRIGVYQPWTANMDEGWTRWLLEQYGFPYTTIHNDDVRAGKLGEK